MTETMIQPQQFGWDARSFNQPSQHGEPLQHVDLLQHVVPQEPGESLFFDAATSVMASRLGWIPYLNLRPHRMIVDSYLAKLGIQGSAIESRPMEGHPSTVNEWLATGKMDVAPSSSINLLNHCHLKMAAQVGVASSGPVQSVYIGGRSCHEEFVADFWQRLQFVADAIQSEHVLNVRAPRDVAKRMIQIGHGLPKRPTMPQIIWSEKSAASVGLGRALKGVLLPMSGIDQSLPPMELVIGDEALIRRCEFDVIIDLGDAWHKMTSLPFVFAIWQCLTPDPEVEAFLKQTATIAQRQMKQSPEVFYPIDYPKMTNGEPIDLVSYWDCIDYVLTAEHMDGMDLYFSLIRELV